MQLDASLCLDPNCQDSRIVYPDDLPKHEYHSSSVKSLHELRIQFDVPNGNLPRIFNSQNMTGAESLIAYISTQMRQTLERVTNGIQDYQQKMIKYCNENIGNINIAWQLVSCIMNNNIESLNKLQDHFPMLSDPSTWRHFNTVKEVEETLQQAIEKLQASLTTILNESKVVEQAYKQVSFEDRIKRRYFVSVNADKYQLYSNKRIVQESRLPVAFDKTSVIFSQIQQQTRLQQQQTNLPSFKCALIKLSVSSFGLVNVSNKSIKFQTMPGQNRDILHYDDDIQDQNPKTRILNYSDIISIQKIKILHHEIGLEFYIKQSKSYLFTFFSYDNRQLFLKAISSYTKNIIMINEAQKNPLLAQVGDKWQKQMFSNFHYLMCLNSIAGRTYNDMHQYPVFPWTFISQSQEQPATYRDLRLPIAALDGDRMARARENYSRRNRNESESNMLHFQTYSHAGITLGWLQRLKPFVQTYENQTIEKIESMSQHWTYVVKSGYAELIPECYYLPGIFQSTQPCTASQPQNLGDIKLPKWVRTQTSEEYVFKMRQHLEGKKTSEELHHWINLIFGEYNQGEQAVRYDNLYPYVAYEQNAISEMRKATQMKDVRARITQMTLYGQIPTQLFLNQATLRSKRYPVKNYQLFKVPFTNIDILPSSFDTYKNIRDPMGQRQRITKLINIPYLGIYVFFENMQMAFIPWKKRNIDFIILKMDRQQDITPQFTQLQIRMSVQTENPANLICAIYKEQRVLFDYHLLKNTSIQAEDVEIKKLFFALGGQEDCSFVLLNALSVKGGRHPTPLKFGYPGDTVVCLDYCPINNLLVAGSQDGRVSLWEVNFNANTIMNEEPTLVLDGHGNANQEVTFVCISGTFDLVFSGNKSGVVLVHHKSGRLINYIRCDALPITQILVHEGGFIFVQQGILLSIYTMTGDEYVRNYQLPDEKCRIHLLSPLQEQFLVITPEGGLLAMDIFSIRLSHDQGYIAQPYTNIEPLLRRPSMLQSRSLITDTPQITSTFMNIEINDKNQDFVMYVGDSSGAIGVLGNKDYYMSQYFSRFQNIDASR